MREEDVERIGGSVKSQWHLDLNMSMRAMSTRTQPHFARKPQYEIT